MIDLMFLKHSAGQLDGIGYAEMTIEPKTVLALLDMLEAAKQDQARYQWLKSRNFPEVFPTSPRTSKGWVVTSVDTDWEDQLGDGKTPDEAIDAAMAATKGEQ